MRFFIYWNNQTSGAPVATIDAENAKAAWKKFSRECVYPVRRDQMTVVTSLR